MQLFFPFFIQCLSCLCLPCSKPDAVFTRSASYISNWKSEADKRTLLNLGLTWPDVSKKSLQKCAESRVLRFNSGARTTLIRNCHLNVSSLCRGDCKAHGEKNKKLVFLTQSAFHSLVSILQQAQTARLPKTGRMRLREQINGFFIYVPSECIINGFIC